MAGVALIKSRIAHTKILTTTLIRFYFTTAAAVSHYYHYLITLLHYYRDTYWWHGGSSSCQVAPFPVQLDLSFSPYLPSCLPRAALRVCWALCAWLWLRVQGSGVSLGVVGFGVWRLCICFKTDKDIGDMTHIYIGDKTHIYICFRTDKDLSSWRCHRKSVYD